MIYFQPSVRNKFLSSFHKRPQSQELVWVLGLLLFSGAAIDLKDPASSLQSVVNMPPGLLRPAGGD